MNWQTIIDIENHSAAAEISYNSNLVLMGSCFTEHISLKMSKLKFSCISNPLGISYNPISILRHIKYTSDQSTFNPSQLFNSVKGYVHYDFHSSLSSTKERASAKLIQDQLFLSYQALKKASHIIISYGTAIVFALENDHVVNNCHKQPQGNFKKQLLSYHQIVQAISDTITELKSINPTANIIFTLSPVRHIKNGLINDRRSKSILHAAINDQVDKHLQCFYFPSYEIVVDELRDYRFYADDMIHPSPMAVNYIWEKFMQSYLKKETIEKVQSIQKLILQLNHRTLQEDSASVVQFKSKLILKLKEKQALGFNFTDDIARLKQEIT